MADRITLDWRRADGPATASVRSARWRVKLTLKPLEAGPRGLGSCSAEVSATEAWDVIEIAAMYNFTNRLALASGMLPNREYHSLHR